MSNLSMFQKRNYNIDAGAMVEASVNSGEHTTNSARSPESMMTGDEQ